MNQVQNGDASDKADERHLDSSGGISNKKLNHFPEMNTKNLYNAVSTDKKSACDSKIIIVDHSSQKTQQAKDLAAVGNGRPIDCENDDDEDDEDLRSPRPSLTVDDANVGQHDEQGSVIASSPNPQPAAMVEEAVEQ